MTGTSMEGGMDAAAPTPEVQAPVSNKLKVKIDGLEKEVDQDELIRDYQKFSSSEKRFQEAAELRKQAQQESQLVANFLQKAQSGDLSWLKGLVPDEQIRSFAESQLLEHIDWESKPQIEREAIMAKREAEQLRKQIEEFTQTKEREESSKIEEQAYQEVEQDIVQSIKTLGYDYKVTPRFIRRIAEQMHASIAASEDPQGRGMPAKDAAQRAFKGLQVDARELLSILPASEVLELLPASVRKAIRQADVQDVRAQAPMMRARNQGGDERDANGRRKFKRVSTDKFFEKMDKRFS